MMKKGKRIPINSVGKIIKEAREKQGLTIEELVWKINKPKINEEIIKDWEKGKEFPDLDSIYLLAENLDLNPNELFQKRLTIQDESIHEVNQANRRVGAKVFHGVFLVVRQCVKWIAGICIIYLALKYSDFHERMGQDPEQYELVEDVIVNAINEYTIYNEVNDERYEAPPLKEYMRKKEKELYNQIYNDKKVENNVVENNTVQNTNVVK